jgi:hypothetical protein
MLELAEHLNFKCGGNKLKQSWIIGEILFLLTISGEFDIT